MWMLIVSSKVCVVDDSKGKGSAKRKEKVALLASLKEIKDELEERHLVVLLMHRDILCLLTT